MPPPGRSCALICPPHHYQRIEFELAELPQQVDAVVATTSLHHVADPTQVIDRITSALRSGRKVIVVEWAWENFDRQTAEWCFKRPGPDDEAGWLHRRRDEWLASGQESPIYLRDWAEREELHAGEVLVGLLDERLEREGLMDGPYFFPELHLLAERARLDLVKLRTEDAHRPSAETSTLGVTPREREGRS